MPDTLLVFKRENSIPMVRTYAGIGAICITAIVFLAGWEVPSVTGTSSSGRVSAWSEYDLSDSPFARLDTIINGKVYWQGAQREVELTLHMEGFDNTEKKRLINFWPRFLGEGADTLRTFISQITLRERLPTDVIPEDPISEPETKEPSLIEELIRLGVEHQLPHFRQIQKDVYENVYFFETIAAVRPKR